MVRYSHLRWALYFGGALAEMAVLLLVLWTGASARIRDAAEKRVRNPLLRAYVYFPLLSAATAVLFLPLAVYSGFVLPHQYGLSNQSAPDWAWDRLRSLAITCVLGPPVVTLLYWTLRRSPQRWWLGFWAASIPLIVVSTVLAPLVIAPLFNRFGPLRNERLKARLLALAADAGIERGRVFEVDASRRTRAVNAYVNGLGGSARIVLWDNLLERLDEEEVLFVMAHEMGHYVEGHVPLGVVGGIAGTLFLLVLTHTGVRRLLLLHGERWKLRGPADLAALPAYLLVLALLNFFGSPVESAISRVFEARADTFALRLRGGGPAAASSYVKLSELNLSLPDPPPFIVWWMFSHPPLQERIDRALAWPEKQGTAISLPE